MSLYCIDGKPHEYEWSTHCGAKVCVVCDDHKDLVRCFCGWAASGGDGKAELEEMGEVIDPEDDDYGFDHPWEIDGDPYR